jgi:hypothetical protein
MDPCDAQRDCRSPLLTFDLLEYADTPIIAYVSSHDTTMIRSIQGEALVSIFYSKATLDQKVACLCDLYNHKY